MILSIDGGRLVMRGRGIRSVAWDLICGCMIRAIDLKSMGLCHVGRLGVKCGW